VQRLHGPQLTISKLFDRAGHGIATFRQPSERDPFAMSAAIPFRKQERAMSKHSYTPLTQAARFLRSHPAHVRKTLNRFGIVERHEGQRTIPNNILDLFQRTKAASGYLYPSWVRTHDDLIAAAAVVPSYQHGDGDSTGESTEQHASKFSAPKPKRTHFA
jgi:hypothetical protein